MQTKKINKKTIEIKNKINKLIVNPLESTDLIKNIQKLETVISIKSNKNATIDLNKNQLIKTKDYEKYLERKKISNKQKLINKNFEYAVEKSKIFSISNNFIDLYISYIFNYFTSFSKFDKIFINNLNINKNIFVVQKKYDNITINMNSTFYEKEYKGNNVNKKINIINKFLINELYLINKILNNNGNALIKLMIFNDKTIPIIELYSLFFEEIILTKNIMICRKFISNNNYSLKLEEIIKNNYKFSINRFKDENKIIRFFNNIEKINEKIYNNFLQDRDENKFVKNRYYLYLNYINSLGLNNFDEFKNLISLQLIDYFKLKIYNQNDIQKIDANINSKEGFFINEIIQKHKFKKCLEVGLAHGISSIYILKNKNTTLISIDPYQKKQWNNEGLNFIKHLKFNDRHTFIEKKSYIALPELLFKDGEKSFDFIFIDGNHLFDYTLIDFFYSDLLLKIGGVIIIDDALHAGVSKFVKFIDNNFKSYKKINSPNTVAAYIKLKDDDRIWSFHQNF